MTASQAESQYNVEITSRRQLNELQRLKQTHGEAVHDWLGEGMPREAMGTPSEMRAFRLHKGTAVPWNVETQNDRSVQRSRTAAADTSPAGDTGVPDSVCEVISSRGQSLDSTVQGMMEDELGESFDAVRIHTGPTAATACESINARAFTVGNHVVFNAGEYQPSSRDGQHVIAHELAHVRQQTGGVVSMLPQKELELDVDPDSQLECEAEATGRRVIEGGSLGRQRLDNTDVHLQRMDHDAGPAATERPRPPDATAAGDVLLAEIALSGLRLEHADISTAERRFRTIALNDRNANVLAAADTNWYEQALQSVPTRRHADGLSSETMPRSRTAIKDEERWIGDKQDDSNRPQIPQSHPAYQARLTLLENQLTALQEESIETLCSQENLEELLEEQIAANSTRFDQLSRFRAVISRETGGPEMRQLMAHIRRQANWNERVDQVRSERAEQSSHDTRIAEQFDTFDERRTRGELPSYTDLSYQNLALADELDFTREKQRTLKAETRPHQLARDERWQARDQETLAGLSTQHRDIILEFRDRRRRQDEIDPEQRVLMNQLRFQHRQTVLRPWDESIDQLPPQDRADLLDARERERTALNRELAAERLHREALNAYAQLFESR